MKGPPGIMNSEGVEGEIDVSLEGSNGKYLEEYGASITAVTNTSTCYVLTALHDVLSIHYILGRGVADFIDIVVDGILRESVSHSKPNIPFKGVVRRVCEQGELKKRPKNTMDRAIPRFSKLQVCKHNTDRDNHSSIVFKGQAEVGSIEIQLFQKSTQDDSSNASDLAARAPSFIEFGTWADKDHNNSVGEYPEVSFEIGFIEARRNSKTAVDRVTKKWSSDFKHVGSVKFFLRSTAELQALGFKDVSPYDVASTPKSMIRSKPATILSKVKNSFIGVSSRTLKAGNKGFDDEDEEESLVVPSLGLSSRSPENASNGNSSDPQGFTFSGYCQDQALLSVRNGTPDAGSTLPNETSFHALQKDTYIKLESDQNQSLTEECRNIDKATTSISGLKGGPAFNAWDDRDKIAQERSREQELEMTMILDGRQSPHAPISMEGADFENPVRHSSIEQGSPVFPIPAFTPINQPSLDIQGRNLPVGKNKEVQDSQITIRTTEEEATETSRVRKGLSRVTVDNSQVSFPPIECFPSIPTMSSDTIFPNSSSCSSSNLSHVLIAIDKFDNQQSANTSPKLSRAPFAIEQDVQESQQMLQTPNGSIKHMNQSLDLGSQEGLSKDALSPFLPSSECSSVPQIPRKDNKRKMDYLNKSPSMLRKEKMSRKALISPAQRIPTELMSNRQAVMTRLSVARQKNKALMQQCKVRLEVQMQKELNEAEELENENAELQAYIDTMVMEEL